MPRPKARSLEERIANFSRTSVRSFRQGNPRLIKMSEKLEIKEETVRGEIADLRKDLRELSKNKNNFGLLRPLKVQLYSKIFSLAQVWWKERQMVMSSWEELNLSGKQMRKLHNEMKMLEEFLEEIAAIQVDLSELDRKEKHSKLRKLSKDSRNTTL